MTAARSVRPIIIIGAPRSGTNMLRDALCALPGFATWPCDEINAVWKHGHLDYPYDDLGPERANERVRRFVRKQFANVARRQDAEAVVEKTCANSLRVGYLRALLPEAAFVFIHRDGYDAVASAIHRWRSRLDLPYTLRKAQFVPVSDVAHYGWRFLRNRLAQRRDRERRLPVWGPMTREIEGLAQAGRVEEAAAAQWAACATLAQRDLAETGAAVLRVPYERFVREPQRELAAIAAFAGCPATEERLTKACGTIYADKIGRGIVALEAAGVLAAVMPMVEPVRTRLGYAPTVPAGLSQRVNA